DELPDRLRRGSLRAVYHGRSDLATVRRPCGLAGRARVKATVSEASRACAVGVHHVHLSHARERDFLPVGRPGRLVVGGWVVRETSGARAVGVPYINLEVVVV